MNTMNYFHLKLIPNFSYRKEKLSVPVRNKDFYLFNLLQRKNMENREHLKLHNNEINNSNNPLRKKKKLIRLKELNINNIFQKVDIKSKKKDESNKNFENNFKFFFLKTKKKVPRYNSCHFITKNKTDKLEISNKIKNPLIITSLNKNNNDLKEKNMNKKTKLKKLKKSFTYKSYTGNEVQKLNEDYFISNSINKNSTKLKLQTKKNEGTQINLNYVNYNNFNNHNNNNTTINRNKYCSPKSIIFQRKFKKFKSLDDKMNI